MGAYMLLSGLAIQKSALLSGGFVFLPYLDAQFAKIVTINAIKATNKVAHDIRNRLWHDCQEVRSGSSAGA